VRQIFQHTKGGQSEHRNYKPSFPGCIQKPLCTRKNKISHCEPAYVYNKLKVLEMDHTCLYKSIYSDQDETERSTSVRSTVCMSGNLTRPWSRDVMLNAVLKRVPVTKNVLTVGAICMIFDAMGVLPVTRLMYYKLWHAKNTRMTRNTRKL
jgi:hypothetical protein